MKNKLFASLIGVCIISIMSTSMFAQPRIPDIKGVKDVSINLACKLTLIQGEKASLTITGDKDELEDVQVKMMGDKLKIFNEDKHQDKDDISITITLPELEKLSIGGAVNITTPNMVNYNALTVEVSGVADFDLKVKSKVFALEASGVISGAIIGETNDFKIEISGVGKLDATEFKAQNCNAEVSGVAKISVYASERLEAEVSGMGKINYAGNPVIRANSSGVGKINKL
jgi:hypothetical protein